jgi:hypothetical protein
MSSRPQGRRIPPFRVKLGKARQKNAPEHVKRASRRCSVRKPTCCMSLRNSRSVLYYREPASSEGTLSPRCRPSNKKQIDVTIGAGPDGYSEIPRCSRRSIVRGS